MNPKILQDIDSLPPIAEKELADFVEFLKYRYERKLGYQESKQSSIKDEPFIGMWKDRTDIADSTEWVRNLRQREWG